MMKIKTITCHDVYNAGASLQAYALAHYLMNLGHDVQIIDYKPDYLSGHYRLWGGVNSAYDKPGLRQLYCLLKLPGRMQRRLSKRKKEYDSFTKKYLPLTERYSSFEELQNSPPEADVYIAGSDQIWNTIFKNGRDPSFYLHFAPEQTVCASYAASFATEHIQPGYEENVTEWLHRLNYISVREKSGLTILEELGIEDGQQVLDPVFLLDKTFWSNFADNWDNPVKQPYILVYDFDCSREMAEYAQKIAKENNWKVVSVLKNPYINADFSNEGPVAFVSLVRSAMLVLSNSFHATAFSLIFEKDFFVFNRKEHINTRMQDLLQAVQLDDRLKGLPDISTKNISINYEISRKYLTSMIDDSQAYIDMVLSSVSLR